MSALEAALEREIDERYLAASAAAVRYVRDRAAEVLAGLGLPALAARPPEELAAALGVAPELRFALAWLLDEAAARGASGEPEAGIPEASRAMLDHVASRYPDYLRGARSGAAILLKPPAVALWEGYFSAANPLYDVHNRLGWAGLREALARLGRPARIVELGAGTGGGTAAVLAGLAAEPELASRVRSLTITDVAPSFLVGTLERLRPLSPVPLERHRLDFSRPPAEQGIAAGSVDLLLAVNALHNGPDLPAALDRLAGALAPGGFLVVSESLCGRGEHVHQDFVFNLLPLPRPEGAGSLSSRFFSASAWSRALAAPLAAEVHANRDGPELALVALARKS